MSTENIQNYIPIQPVQNSIPVQSVNNNYLPVSQMKTNTFSQYPQVQQERNYIPRYMPLVQNGQVYPVPVPQQMQQNQPALKSGGVSAVNITINGVNQPGQGQAPVAQAPQSVPTYLPYYVPQPPVNIPVQEPKKLPEPKNEALLAPKIENKLEEKKTQENKKKKQVIELTDSYIQQLEKKLNDKDKNERAHAVAELVARFKEDETRKDDKRLTNLLNLSLQDSSKPIVYGAMQAIENGYANGNIITEQRLQSIKNSHDTFGNSETAEGLLTKFEGMKSDTKNIEDTNVSGKKLDLMAG